jgi:hypothetical protein
VPCLGHLGPQELADPTQFYFFINYYYIHIYNIGPLYTNEYEVNWLAGESFLPTVLNDQGPNLDRAPFCTGISGQGDTLSPSGNLFRVNVG